MRECAQSSDESLGLGFDQISPNVNKIRAPSRRNYGFFWSMRCDIYASCLTNAINSQKFQTIASSSSRFAYIVWAMLNDVYNKRILQLAGNIPLTERLENPDATAKAYSKLCGSRVVVDLNMKDGVVTAFGQDVKACALGQASSAIMAQLVIGSTAEEIRKAGAAMRAMLMENGPAPTGKWKEFEILEPVKNFKARHASTLLTFDAVEDAIAQIEAGE